MIYRVIGVGYEAFTEDLNLVFVEFHESGGRWGFEWGAETTVPLPSSLSLSNNDLFSKTTLQYLLWEKELAAFVSTAVQSFIQRENLHHRVQMIGIQPLSLELQHQRSGQIDHRFNPIIGHAVAARTGIPTVEGFSLSDVAMGGTGYPLWLKSERLLLPGFDAYLHLGEEAALFCCNPAQSFHLLGPCNALFASVSNDHQFSDPHGEHLGTGKIRETYLAKWEELFATNAPFSAFSAWLSESGWPMHDALYSFTTVLKNRLHQLLKSQLAKDSPLSTENFRLLVTGSFSENRTFLEILDEGLEELGVEMLVPDARLRTYHQALVSAHMAVLRWRQEEITIPALTGASASISAGTIWSGW